MVREISREIDYISEGVALLQHLGTGERYSDIRESLCNRFDNPFQEGLKKFALLEKIERGAKKLFQKDMEEIRYYFLVTGDGNLGCAGSAAILWEACREAGFGDVYEYGKYLEGLSEREYCERFGKCLYCYHNIENDGREKTEEPIDVISFLMKMDLKDEEKWKLQKIFFGREEHSKKVLMLLKKAAAFLKDFEEEFLELLHAFFDYWEKALNGRSFAAYAKEMMDIDIGENPLGFYLYPSIMMPNVVVFQSDMEKEGVYRTPDHFRIGILFDYDFDIQTSCKNKENGSVDYVTQVLKLISDKSKFEILTYIRDREAYGSELAKHLNLTTATVSHHMNALLSAGLVEIKRMDTRIYYLANKKALREVLDYSKKLLTGEA